MKFKGITVGTYVSKRPKGKYDETICANCKNNKNKNIDKKKQYELCKGCDKFYVSKTCKAVLTIGRDQTTGKILKKSFVADTEEEALNNALEYKINLDRNGGPRIITKTNKTFIELVKPLIEEQFKLNRIKESTYKRKLDTLKQIEKEAFANKPIAKVSRDDVVNYLAKLKKYSKTTIKQNYELLCMGFGEAYHQQIIKENFLAGYKRIEKPKSEYVGHHRIALTIEEQRILTDFLNTVEYSKFKHKYLFLLLLSTGMRIGETTKTSSGQRIINLNDISKKALEGAFNHITPNKFHLLFYNPTNKKYGLYEEASINSALKRAGLKLGIGLYEEENSKGKKVTRTDLHTHMLRATFATRCAEAKIAPAVLKDLLGHSDISVTMKYYVDIDTDFINSENKNVVNYLIDKNIFNVPENDTEIAI